MHSTERFVGTSLHEQQCFMFSLLFYEKLLKFIDKPNQCESALKKITYMQGTLLDCISVDIFKIHSIMSSHIFHHLMCYADLSGCFISIPISIK